MKSGRKWGKESKFEGVIRQWSSREKNDGKLVATTSTIDRFFGALIVQKRAASIRIDCATNRFTLDGLENARAIGSLESGNLIIRTERINEGAKPRFCARERFSLLRIGKSGYQNFSE